MCRRPAARGSRLSRGASEGNGPLSGGTVLLVEDSTAQRAVIAHRLEQIGYSVASAEDGHECLRLLVDVRPDIVLLDIVMPGIDGWETLDMIREVSQVPVIMLTARDEDVERVRGLRAGADDYIGKPFQQDELEARIEAVLRRSQLAHRDELTGLPNRRAFEEHLDALLRRPGEQELVLVLFDLDNFKQINDREGHPAGDRVLREVSRVAQRAVRIGEELFRIGGEEFAIVVSGGDDAGRSVAERVRSAVEAQRRGDRLPTLSAGVASLPGDAQSKDELVQRADLALYAAKQAGKNRVASADVG